MDSIEITLITEEHGSVIIPLYLGEEETFLLSATQNAKSGKARDKPKLSGINQHKADCYAVCCVSQVVYPARCSKVSCQKIGAFLHRFFYIC